MATAAELLVKINADTSGAEAGMQRVSAKVEGFGSTLKTALGTATGFLGAQLVGQLVGNFGQAISAGLDFGAQMANVNSILQLTTTGLNDLSDQVLQLAHNPGITQGPAELASGLYDISSSGFAGADGMKVLEAAAIAATAGVTTTATSAQAITAALNAYGLSAENAASISDQMFTVVNDGVISFEQLSKNLGNTLPIAASLGIGFDQLGAAYAQMTLQGVGASQAETQIASLMRSALAPTDALTAAIQEHGYASAEALISTEGLSGFLQVLTDASGGSKEALFNLLGTQEAMNAATLLGGKNLDAYNAEVERMKHASDGAGATQTALNKQMESASFQIAKARQEAMILATTLVRYVSPSIAKIAGAGAKGIASFTKWLDKALVGQIRWYKAMGRTNVEALFSALGITLENLTGIDVDGWFKRMGDAMQRPLDALGKFFDAIGDRNWRKATAAIGDFISSGPKLLGDALKGVNTRWETLNTIMHLAGRTLTDVGRLFQEIGQGDFAGAKDVFLRLTGHVEATAVAVFKGIVDGGGAAISDLWGWVAGKITGKTGGTAGPTGLYDANGDQIMGGGGDKASVADVAVAIGTKAVALFKGLFSFGGEKIGNLFDWVRKQAGGGATFGPNGSMDPALGYSGPANASDVAVGIGTKAVAFFTGLVSDAGEAIGDLFSWVRGKVTSGTTYGPNGSMDPARGYSGGGDITLPISVDGVVSFLGDLLAIQTDFQTWLSQKIGKPTADLIVNINMKLDEGVADSAFTSGQNIGSTMMTKFIDGVVAGFGGGTSGGGNGEGGDFGAMKAILTMPVKLQAIAGQFVAGLIVGIGDAAAAAIWDGAEVVGAKIRVATQGLMSKIGDVIGGVFGEGLTFGPNGSMDPSQGFSAGSDGAIANITTGIVNLVTDGVTGAISALSGKVDGWKTDITDKVKSVVPDSITLPGIDFDFALVGGSIQSVKTWIDNQVEILKRYWNKLQFWKDGGTTDANPLSFNAMSQTQGLVFGAGVGRPETDPVPQPEAAPTPTTLVKIDADTSLADTKIGTLNDKVTTLTASPFTGILDFDNGPAAVKYTDTFNWGTVFDAATFTSTFDIDNGPAAVAYTNAFGWGNTWASQVFTASFSVDTSGITNAVAIARQAAADIAAVMPHSPAKEGPLKEPITFDYIADNMRGVADRLRGYAASGAGYVRDSFNDGPGWSMAAAGGRDRGGDTYIVITPDSEQFADIARKARQGDLNWKTLSAVRQRNM